MWPRQREGVIYSIGKPQVEVTENDDYVVINTNNIPDHDLHTNNPNCASPQNYTFKIPKQPLLFDTPLPVTRDMQAIGVALNGIVIAGPYDSQGKIAPHNRQVDQCSAHADPEGMYHYHFAPLCMRDANNHMLALDANEQIGWSFDGYKLMVWWIATTTCPKSTPAMAMTMVASTITTRQSTFRFSWDASKRNPTPVTSIKSAKAHSADAPQTSGREAPGAVGDLISKMQRKFWASLRET